MGLPGVRNVILRGTLSPSYPPRHVPLSAATAQHAFRALPVCAGDGRPRPGRSLFLFSNPSDTYDLRQQLRITNRLTAYAYLLDARQRVRYVGRSLPPREEAIA